MIPSPADTKRKLAVVYRAALNLAAARFPVRAVATEVGVVLLQRVLVPQDRAGVEEGPAVALEVAAALEALSVEAGADGDVNHEVFGAPIRQCRSAYCFNYTSAN